MRENPNCKNVWEVNPIDAVGDRPVGLLWASPDCKHFSKAKGGKPETPELRSRDEQWMRQYLEQQDADRLERWRRQSENRHRTRDVLRPEPRTDLHPNHPDHK